MNKSELLSRMEKVGVSPKRSLGQNFLISDHVVSKIIQATKLACPDQVVEIGPGLGSLTDHLLQIPDLFFQVIELDKTFAEYWRNHDVNVIEQDAMKFDWSVLKSQFVEKKSVLVSNLPYQISASLVMELSSVSAPIFQSLILMFQKEVAERIVALPRTKDYGLLSVVAQNRWNIKKVVDASAACFYPRPRVSSRVLQFSWKSSGNGSASFTRFLKMGFQNRRKLLVKSLNGVDSHLNWEGELSKIGKKSTVRAEELSPSEWCQLYQFFQEALKNEH